MKKIKLLFGSLAVASLVLLASCKLSDSIFEDDEEYTYVEPTTTRIRRTTTTKEATTTEKKVMKYEELDYSVRIWTNSIGSKWIQVAVPVKDTGNVPIYLSSMSVDVESSSGDLLQTISYINGYPDYLKPGETGYYYKETTCDFEDDEVNLVTHLDVKSTHNEVIRYNVSDISFQDDNTFGVKVLGRVENQTDEEGSLVYVVANLYDSSNNLLSSCFTILDDNLASHDKIGFTLSQYSYRDFTVADVASYEVYSYPTQFNF